MKIKWYGHASFLLTSDQGTKIITDPYEPGGFGGAIAYGPIPDEADIVLVSHDHADHNYVQGLRGKPQVIKGNGSHKAKGMEFDKVIYVPTKPRNSSNRHLTQKKWLLILALVLITGWISLTVWGILI